MGMNRCDVTTHIKVHDRQTKEDGFEATIIERNCSARAALSIEGDAIATIQKRHAESVAKLDADNK